MRVRELITRLYGIRDLVVLPEPLLRSVVLMNTRMDDGTPPPGKGRRKGKRG
jgi:hypothetical protein